MSDQDDNKLITERRAKLATLREAGNPFINDFKPANLAQDIINDYNGFSKEDFDPFVCPRLIIASLLNPVTNITPFTLIAEQLG